MLKLLISNYAHPALGRAAANAHMEHHHTPLILSVPAVVDTLKRYRQNVILTQEDGYCGETLYRREEVRRAVIELVFEDGAAMTAMTQDPEYMARVRPDEQHMSDRTAPRFAVSTREQIVFGGPEPGGIKVFDMLQRRAGVSRADYLSAIEAAGRTLAGTPGYRSAVRREVHNIVVEADAGPFRISGSQEAVLELWVDSLEGLAPFLALRRRLLADVVDETESFSVIARERTVIDKLGPGPDLSA